MYSVFLYVHSVVLIGMSRGRVHFPVYFDLIANELGSFNLLQPKGQLLGTFCSQNAQNGMSQPSKAVISAKCPPCNLCALKWILDRPFGN